MIIVYAYVVGDILHIGHINYLKNARALGDNLIVGVLTDKAVMEKKDKPVIPFEQRCATVEALRYVDCVVPQEAYSPLDNVRRINPDILVESDSHPEQPANDYMRSAGKRVVVLPYTKGVSTTEIKNKIREK